MSAPDDDDMDLGASFRAVRDRFDGTNPDASEATLRRALLHTRKERRQRRLTRWVVLPIAATLAASTAWAGVTGRLAPAVSSLGEVFRTEHAPPALPPPPVAAAPKKIDAPAEAAPADVPSAPVEPDPAHPPPVVATRPPEPPSVRERAPSAAPLAPPPAPTTSASDPNAALFAEAHRLHFQEHDPARALPAWDRYLAAAPNGRFAPEARYNRALTLVRLGRHHEAKQALEGFANGSFGEYRRSDAKALLEALARDQ